jgi:hypothetical protein
MNAPEFLIDGWLHNADPCDVHELLDEIAFVEALRGLLAATAENKSLGQMDDLVDMAVKSYVLCTTVRAIIDLQHGARLAADLAAAEGEELERVRRGNISNIVEI